MSKSAKSPAPGPSSTLPFEEALNRLEKLIADMESDDLPLEQLLDRYKEAAELSRQCRARLADAETKLQQLERDAEGVPHTRELELEPETEP